jgi:hypothetical protein
MMDRVSKGGENRAGFWQCATHTPLVGFRNAMKTVTAIGDARTPRI